MARPKKENADYHTHDKDMRNDPKIRALRKRYKHEGYAVYNMMLEVLTDADHFRYEWNPLNIEILSGDFDTENLEEIIVYCTEKLELFKIENGFIYSENHQKRFNPLLSKRKRDNNHVFASENTESKTKQLISAVENPHSIVKYSKVEDSKVNIPTDTVTSLIAVGEPAAAGSAATTVSIEEKLDKPGKKKKNAPGAGREIPSSVYHVLEYIAEKMKGKWPPAKISITANKFFNHYEANGWMQNKGKPIISWKAAANMWIYNEVEGTYVHPVAVAQPSGPSQKSQDKPEEPKLTFDQKQELNRGFLQDCYEDFCAGRLFTGNMLGLYYNQLLTDGLLILSEEEKEKIRKQTNGNATESKNIAVTNYFKALQLKGVSKVYGLAKS